MPLNTMKPLTVLKMIGFPIHVRQVSRSLSSAFSRIRMMMTPTVHSSKKKYMDIHRHISFQPQSRSHRRKAKDYASYQCWPISKNSSIVVTLTGPMGVVQIRKDPRKVAATTGCDAQNGRRKNIGVQRPHRGRGDNQGIHYTTSVAK